MRVQKTSDFIDLMFVSSPGPINWLMCVWKDYNDVIALKGIVHVVYTTFLLWSLKEIF